MCQNCNQNNCGGCTETTTICNQCTSEQTTCDCAVLLSTDCITYDQDDIECNSVVVVAKNTILSDALNNIVSWSCTKFAELANYLRIINVGTGASIYAGDNLIGEKKLRKINSTSPIVTVTENTNDISLGIDSASLDTFIEANQKTYTAVNVGTGANVYKDSTVVGNNTQLNLRKINTSNSGTGATILKTQVENTSDISISAKSLLAESQGEGVSIIKDLQSNTDDNKLRLRSFVSSDNSVNIDQTTDTIDITVPALPSFGYLKSFYVNSGYAPTVDSPSDGSIIRPYITFDEAKTAFIGTGDIVSPQYAGGTIILQTPSTTATNPTVNKLNISFENDCRLTYTGTDLYMFDTEVLYPLIPKNVPRNDLTIDIHITLSGKGGITRTAGIGLVRGLGSNRNGLGEIDDKYSQIVIGLNKEDVIMLEERVDYPSNIWDGDITNEIGVTLESYYNASHKYSLQLTPTMPLLYAQYEAIAPFKWGVTSNGTIRFLTLANSAVKIVGINLIGNNFDFLVRGNYISTVSAIKMVDYPTYYQPHPNRFMIELDGGRIDCDELRISDQGGYRTTGIDSFLYIKNDGSFGSGRMALLSNYYINKFLNVSDITNASTSFNLNNGLLESNLDIIACRYLLDTPSPTYTLKMPKTTISTFLNKSTTPVIITPNTLGTLSSFFGVPVMSGISDYANDAAATAGGLVPNSLYFNTTNNALDKI